MNWQFGEYIRQRLLERDWKAVTLAKRSGLSHVYIGCILNGEDPKTGKPPNITLNTLSAIAKALDIPPEILLNLYYGKNYQENDSEKAALPSSSPKASAAGIQLTPVDGLYRIPLKGSVSAGELAHEERPQDILYYDWYDIKEFSSDLFCLKVRGNSMFPPVEDGAILLVRPAKQLRNKGRYVVQTEGGETTFKLIEFQEDGAKLIPLNPAYDPIPIHTINIGKLYEVLGYKVDWT